MENFKKVVRNKKKEVNMWIIVSCICRYAQKEQRSQEERGNGQNMFN